MKKLVILLLLCYTTPSFSSLAQTKQNDTSVMQLSLPARAQAFRIVLRSLLINGYYELKK